MESQQLTQGRENLDCGEWLFFVDDFQVGESIHDIYYLLWDESALKEIISLCVICVCTAFMVNLFSLFFFLYSGDNYRDWQIANAILLGKFVSPFVVLFTHLCMSMYLFIYLFSCVMCVYGRKSVVSFSIFEHFCYLLPWRWNFLAAALFIIILHMVHTHTFTHKHSMHCKS